MSPVKFLLKKHAGLFFLIPYAVFLVFSGLGDSVLQLDEGLDTFITTTILKYGIPHHSDGINHTMDFADIYDGLFVYRTWVPYYLQASSFLLFGQNTFAARLPFALCGVFSVLLLYFLTLKLTAKKSIAFLAALFLASSVPALIYFRTARYVGLPVLFTILLLYFYIDLIRGNKRSALGFTVTAILYFQTMYVEFASTSFGVILHLILIQKTLDREKIKTVVSSFIIIGLFCVPWILYISPVFSHISETLGNSSKAIDLSAWGYLKRFPAFLFQLNNYIFPFIFLPLVFLKPLKVYRTQVQLLLICISTIIITATLHPIPSQFYITACFPLLFILLAMILVECFKNIILRGCVILLLITTNLIHVGPLLPVKQALLNQPDLFQQNRYLSRAYHSFMMQVNVRSLYYKHWYEITHPYRGPLDTVVEFFQNHGSPGQTAFIDNEGDAFIFYSRMKLTRKSELSASDKPDWIILRGGKISVEESADSVSPTAQKLKDIIRSHPYKKIILKGPVDRINNSYDIQLHRFKTRSTTNKVVIYQLQKAS